MNEEYRLQLLSHGQIFPTREEALEYIEDVFKGFAKWAEPALFFYGSEREPKMILAFGASKNASRPRVCFIDDAELRELIAAVQEATDQNTEDIAKTSERLLNVINVVGLTLDENKIVNQVSYDPDPSDELIRNAQTVADAIAIISTFVQEKVKELATTFIDTKSVAFTKEQTETGSTVKADVKISTEGDDDDLEFNNNIVGIKPDGVFASCNIEYDAERNRLIFTTSGMKNGRFVTDANKKIIDFGAHTIYTADNEGHNINVIINQERGTISADAKLSESEDNILKVVDGKLTVDGRAKNIKFQNTTVAAKLVEFTNAIAEIQEKIAVLDLNDLIVGDESDSILTRAIKNPNGGYTITADSRFGSDNSIVIANGGLSANIDVEVDTAANKLVLKVGNVNKSVTLPGVSIIDNIYYDAANKAIVITWKDGSQQTVIPVGDMLKTWDVYNNPSSAVTLTKSSPATGPELLSAEVKIRTTDNLLGKTSGGELFVNKSDIDNAIAVVQNAVTTETNARIAADSEINASVANVSASLDLTNANLANEVTRATTAEGEIAADVASLGARVTTAEENVTQAVADAAAAMSQVELTNANLEAEVRRAQTAEGVISDDVTSLTSRMTTAEGQISQAFADAADAKAIAEQVDTKLTAEVNRAQAAEANLEADINEVDTQVDGLAGELEAEKLARATADAVQDEKIATLQSDLASAEASHNTDINRLQGLITDNSNAIAVLNGPASQSGSVLEAVEIAKAYADNVGAAEQTRATAAEQANATAIANEVSRATAAEAQGLADSKAYTDDKVAYAQHLAEDYTDAAKREAIETSGTNADAKVAAEAARAQAAEQANAAEIVALKAKDEEIDVELAKKIESVTVEQSTASNRQYIIKVDGVPAGEINIPEDQFIREVHYDAGNKAIVFTFVTESGETVLNVDVSDLVDTYTAGNGLKLDDNNQFSVVINEDSETYLSLTAEGLKLFGIDAALAAKANAADVYTKAEADAKFLTEHQDISGLATKAELAPVSAKADANEAAITVINGNEAQDGSIKKALADAKSYADGIVTAEASRATAAEQANADAITIINGNEAQDGSIKKALADAKSYSDNLIASESQARIAADNLINDAIATKANADNVYTKAQIDAKGYLVASDIATKAERAELDAEVTRAQTAEAGLAADIAEANGKIAANTTDIIDLQRESARLNLIVDETNSVKLTKSKDDTGTELSADVKLDITNTNILKITGNGLTADVEMSYSQATNTITFSNGLTTQEFQLAGASLLEDGYYNAATKQIILITRLADGTTKEIVIDAESLIHTLKVDNGLNNPIKLAKTTDSEGVDVLSARLDISTEAHNLILNNNGTLYASNEAKNHTALWNGTEKTLQEVLELLKTEAEAGSEAAEEIAEIEAEVHDLELQVANVRTEIVTINQRVTDNTTAIAQNAGAINTLSNQVSELNSAFTNLSNEFTELETTVESYDGRMTALETDNVVIKEGLENLSTAVENLGDEVDGVKANITVIENKLGNISIEHPVSERLEYLEQEIQGVDNGTY